MQVCVPKQQATKAKSWRGARLLMREYIRIGPAHQVEPRPCGHKVETGGGDLEAVLALEHRVKADAQGMQIEDVGRRGGKLRLRERRVAPIGGLLLLG